MQDVKQGLDSGEGNSTQVVNLPFAVAKNIALDVLKDNFKGTYITDAGDRLYAQDPNTVLGVKIEVIDGEHTRVTIHSERHVKTRIFITLSNDGFWKEFTKKMNGGKQ